mgnify:CR=1 FL=1
MMKKFWIKRAGYKHIPNSSLVVNFVAGDQEFSCALCPESIQELEFIWFEYDRLVRQEREKK